LEPFQFLTQNPDFPNPKPRLPGGKHFETFLETLQGEKSSPAYCCDQFLQHRFEKLQKNLDRYVVKNVDTHLRRKVIKFIIEKYFIVSDLNF